MSDIYTISEQKIPFIITTATTITTTTTTITTTTTTIKKSLMFVNVDIHQNILPVWTNMIPYHQKCSDAWYKSM